MSLVYEEAKLKQLQLAIGRSQLSKGGLGTQELGNLALRVLIERRTIQNALSREGTSKKDKAEAKRRLKEIEELEKGIYRLYYVSTLKKRERSRETKIPFQWHL